LNSFGGENIDEDPAAPDAIPALPVGSGVFRVQPLLPTDDGNWGDVVSFMVK
jgi:hypothetical protein